MKYQWLWNTNSSQCPLQNSAAPPSSCKQQEEVHPIRALPPFWDSGYIYQLPAASSCTQRLCRSSARVCPPYLHITAAYREVNRDGRLSLPVLKFQWDRENFLKINSLLPQGSCHTRAYWNANYQLQRQGWIRSYFESNYIRLQNSKYFILAYSVWGQPASKGDLGGSPRPSNWSMVQALTSSSPDKTFFCWALLGFCSAPTAILQEIQFCTWENSDGCETWTTGWGCQKGLRTSCITCMRSGFSLQTAPKESFLLKLLLVCATRRGIWAANNIALL